MHIDWSTLALQLVNFAILIWLLQRFLYRPTLRVVDARRAAIEAERAEVDKLKQGEQALRAALETGQAAIASERVAALKAAAAQAEAEAAARREQAEREAKALLAATRNTLAKEREEALGEARRAALDLTEQVARRLLAEFPEALRGAAWLERIEQHLASLPPAERAALADELADGAALRVVTASALPADRAEIWRARLQRALGRDIPITFETAPELMAGAELRFPRATLRFGLRSILDRLQAEERSRGAPR